MISNNSNKIKIKVDILSIQEIEDFIKNTPSLILPVGGYEPLGKETIINGFNLCCEKIAESYAFQNKILMSPLITTGYTIPFKGFGGCAGISRDSLRDVILDLCNSWIFMGIKRILIISTATYNREAILPAIQIINKKKKVECIKLFSLQHSEEFCSFCNSYFGVNCYERYEVGILALLIYLFPDIFREKNLQIPLRLTIPQQDKIKRWERLGKDPKKLRNLAPEGFLSDIKGKTITADDGRKLFEYILEVLNKKYYHFLIEGKYDS